MRRQLFTSKDFNCGEEILTIAAMISIQVSPSLDRRPYHIYLFISTGCIYHT
jgi:hypothetical protein